MGFFSKFFGQAKEQTKLSNAVVNVKNMLDAYESDPDSSFLFCAAWICKVGVMDLIIKNNWLPNHLVYVPINGHQTKMYMAQVQLITIARLKKTVSQSCNTKLEKTIDDILAGGASFEEIDAKIPQKFRDIIS